MFEWLIFSRAFMKSVQCTLYLLINMTNSDQRLNCHKYMMVILIYTPILSIYCGQR